jgi:7-cyano-7-deazaguanine reductase
MPRRWDAQKRKLCAHKVLRLSDTVHPSQAAPKQVFNLGEKFVTDVLLKKSPLGREITYPQTYDPALLFPIPRSKNRAQLGLSETSHPFSGVDIWNAYELSWLEAGTRKPRIAIAEFYIPSDSKNLIESKSFKLYLNSLNQCQFKNEAELKEALLSDIAKAVDAPVRVYLQLPPFDNFSRPSHDFSGDYLDDLPVMVDAFEPTPAFLTVDPDTHVCERLYSNLLKSNCPETGQPDWGSVAIRYRGNKINRLSLLKYIISFREHTAFHEDCVERMFMDILRICQPEKLTVYARYTRRGGIDINPFRSNFERPPSNIRNLRQ